nr:5-formyltetrahydrofolate cyclo-ligase [Chitinophagaceae bacterium]
TEWGLSSFGVEEPLTGKPVDPGMIDLVFVPLLAFDKKGYRVGYGKGYYDRFLKRCRPDVMTLGLSLFPPVEAIGDLHTNDVPLKYCITPHKIYAF